MGQVGEGAGVDEDRLSLQSLNQVGMDGILKQQRHRPDHLQLASVHRPSLLIERNDHPPQSFLHVRQSVGQPQDGHDLAGHGDVETAHPMQIADPPMTCLDVAQVAIRDLCHPTPKDLFRIYPKFIPMDDMILHNGCHQVVGCANGMDVTRKMEIDIFHGKDLGITRSTRPTLDPKDGGNGRFAQSQYHLLTQTTQRLGQPNGGGCLSLPRWRGGHGGHHDQPTVGAASDPIQKAQQDLRLVCPVHLDLFQSDPGPAGHLNDLQWPSGSSDLGIGWNGAHSFYGHGKSIYMGRSDHIEFQRPFEQPNPSQRSVTQKQNGDHIEPNGCSIGNPSGLHIPMGQTAQTPAFGIHHRLLWKPESRPPSGFDLDEAQGNPIPSHHIHFPKSATDIPIGHTITMPFQKTDGFLLTMPTQKERLCPLELIQRPFPGWDENCNDGTNWARMPEDA